MRDFQQAVGKTIRKLRTQRGLTQSDLSERSSLERSYISEVETGARNIALLNFKRLADAFDLGAWEVLKMAESLLESDDE
jgi:transcriptional regulator with XRE-family HTH domain